MLKVKVTTVQDTYALASTIASCLSSPCLIVLSGDLGAGKTTFTKGFAKALGIKQTLTSPTFTILKTYEENDIVLHHIDAYRLEGMVQDLGFEELFDEDAFCIVEWFDFIEYTLPKERISIYISLDEEDRIFEIEAVGEKYNKVLEVLA